MTVYLLWWGTKYGDQEVVDVYLRYEDAKAAKAKADEKLDPGQRSYHDVESREVIE